LASTHRVSIATVVDVVDELIQVLNSKVSIDAYSSRCCCMGFVLLNFVNVGFSQLLIIG
jgi:hypothetical protein